MTKFSLLAGGIAGWWASIEDAMAEATVNTIIGISVVFLALLFISFVISLFKYINKFEQNFLCFFNLVLRWSRIHNCFI